MKLYHYSVETFQAADDELVGDYKNQYLVYEPYIICLQNHENLFEVMLYMARYNQVCAENKGNRMFSYWVKDATEAVFEYIRTTEFQEDSASRIKGIYYCESIEEAVKYLTEDCINTAGFKKDDVSLFEVELEKDIFYAYDQSFLLMEFLEASPRRKDYWETLGRELALMHRCSTERFVTGRTYASDGSQIGDDESGGNKKGTASENNILRYGFYTDNYIGATLQKNTPKSGWIEFFRDCRLTPQLQMAEKQLGMRTRLKCEHLLERLDSLLEEPEFPSLLHGDFHVKVLGKGVV